MHRNNADQGNKYLSYAIKIIMTTYQQRNNFLLTISYITMSYKLIDWTDIHVSRHFA